MGKRKKRGRKMPAWRKVAKAAIGIFGKGVGITVVASPAILAIQKSWSVPQNIPAGIAHEYTGFSILTGTFDWRKTAQGVGSVVIGVALMKLFGYVARSV